jgi:hypothetical protein
LFEYESNIKKFRNKQPRNKIKESLIVLSFLGFFSLSTIYYYSYFVSPLVNIRNLPEIRILCDEKLDTDGMTECSIEIESQDKKKCVEPMKAHIKIRGGEAGVSSYPKKGYRLKLSEDVSLLGIEPKEDDWNLYAMYLDFSRIRIKLASDLWGSLNYMNPTAISIESQFVYVYFNGELQGLYLLAQRYNRKLFGLENEQNNLNSSLIFQAKGGCDLAYEPNGRWQQDWPNEYEGFHLIEQILFELSYFITNTDNELFFDSEDGIYSKFYKKNLIDFFIFNFFIDHRDFWNKNYYIIRDSYPSKFFLIPCDYDGCLGQYGWNSYESDSNPEEYIRAHNLLFGRLLNNEAFIQECKDRWLEIRETLWTEEYIYDKVYDIYEEIKDSVEIEKYLWSNTIVDFSKKDREEDFEDYINRLIEYIPERLDFCDIYFEEK